MKSISYNKLTADHYLDNDVVKLARYYLGKELHTHIDNCHVSGIIVETEAYCGSNDRACHAYPNKRTKRTSTMYLPGGVAYVYLVYGLHHLFNIVTNIENKADAVLIRALEPKTGIDTMMHRRSVATNTKVLTSGPARLTQALGITVKDDGMDLQSDRIWLTDNERIDPSNITAEARVGVDYAGEDALLPWRFYIRGNNYVSK